MTWILIGLVLLVGSFLAGVAVGGKYTDPRLTRPERRELKLRREADNKLLKFCLDNMDVEPYARVVYDKLSATQKEISS